MWDLFKTDNGMILAFFISGVLSINSEDSKTNIKIPS
jgi:hypothetical protein